MLCSAIDVGKHALCYPMSVLLASMAALAVTNFYYGNFYQSQSLFCLITCALLLNGFNCFSIPIGSYFMFFVGSSCDVLFCITYVFVFVCVFLFHCVLCHAQKGLC